jgi:hypothetical protein
MFESDTIACMPRLKVWAIDRNRDSTGRVRRPGALRQGMSHFYCVSQHVSIADPESHGVLDSITIKKKSHVPAI